MFYARLYGLAAAKVGVPDYRRLVDQKLRTAGELYRFMVDQFNQTRSFVLELAVVVILIVDLFFLFRGKQAIRFNPDSRAPLRIRTHPPLSSPHSQSSLH